jgi:hypothetical protein
MIISGPLFIILLIHWELMKWMVLQVILGSFAIGREDDCGSEA